MSTMYRKPGIVDISGPFESFTNPQELDFALDEPLDVNCLRRWSYEYVKRAVDFCTAGLLLALFFIPGLVIAMAIKLTSPGPVFYREERVGRSGRPFRIWKFRSMDVRKTRGTVEHEDALSFGRRVNKRGGQDPRITSVGQLLRSWSLDELPQLLNVIWGEMSLVGPRPIVQAETSLYAELLPFYLAAVPGMSGLWQVSGRCNMEYEERVELDATYVVSWSLGMDLKILAKTLPAVLSREGAR